MPGLIGVSAYTLRIMSKRSAMERPPGGRRQRGFSWSFLDACLLVPSCEACQCAPQGLCETNSVQLEFAAVVLLEARVLLGFRQNAVARNQQVEFGTHEAMEGIFR